MISPDESTALSTPRTALAPAPAARRMLSPYQMIVEQDGAGEFNAIRSRDLRSGILAKLGAMAKIEWLRDGGMTIKKAVQTVSEEMQGERGCSTTQLNAYFSLWRKGGRKRGANGQPNGPVFSARDWHIFVPGYTNGDTEAMLDNEELVAHLRSLAANGVRKARSPRQVQTQLLNDWYAGKDVPGAGNIRRFCAMQGRAVPTGHRHDPRDYPRGWSETNIARALEDNSAVSTLAKYGEHRAHDKLGAQLQRDRSLLMPQQMVTYDDHDVNVEVYYPLPGNRVQIIQPKLLLALDVATGYILHYGVLPPLKRDRDEDGGKTGTARSFRTLHMRQLFMDQLEMYGVPRDWQSLHLHEQATAKFSDLDKLVIGRFMPSLDFEATHVYHRKALSGWDDTGGSPWQKAWVEALFSLLENHMDTLPGSVPFRANLQLGRNDHEARRTYTERTVKAALEKGVPLEELKLPILSWEQFTAALDHVITLMNHRTRHDLQGFDHRVYEVEHGGQFITRDQNPTLFDQLCREGAQPTHRKESPYERFTRLRQGHIFDRPHPHVLALLSQDKFPVTVNARGHVVVKLPDFGDKVTYWDDESAAAVAPWAQKEKALLGILSPGGERIHLVTNDEEMQHVASPCAYGRRNLADRSDIMQGVQEVHQHREQMRELAATHLAPQRAAAQEMREHNDAMLNPAATRLAEDIKQAETSALSRKPKQSDIRRQRERNARLARLRPETLTH